jgi:hypothetical protein
LLVLLVAKNIKIEAVVVVIVVEAVAHQLQRLHLILVLK